MFLLAEYLVLFLKQLDFPPYLLHPTAFVKHSPHVFNTVLEHIPSLFLQRNPEQLQSKNKVAVTPNQKIEIWGELCCYML